MLSKNLYRSFFQMGKCYKDCEQNTRILQVATRNIFVDTKVSLFSKEDTAFYDALPGILDNLVQSPKLAQSPGGSNWIKEMIEYNMRGGKYYRGAITTLAYEMLEKPENITQESLHLSRVLGWCVEMLHAQLLIMDDMLDQSTTRRNLSCWYRLPNVGIRAINDSVIIYSSIMHTIDLYFGKTPIYVDILKLFNDTLLTTLLGQHLDYSTPHEHNNDYSTFTLNRFYTITKYKTTYYTFKLPVFLGLLQLRNIDKAVYPKIEEICLDIGKLYQIQDDFLDVYGDESITGKIGTDIQEGKCNWLSVTALQRCNAEQRDVFVKNYGSKDPSRVERIKLLYDNLQIPELYKLQEKELYNDLMRRVRTLPKEISPKLFLKLFDIMYNREK